MPLPTYIVFEKPLNGIPHPLPERGLLVTPLREKPGLPDLLPIDLYDDLARTTVTASVTRRLAVQAFDVSNTGL
jgi:hypothetical protein